MSQFLLKNCSHSSCYAWVMTIDLFVHAGHFVLTAYQKCFETNMHSKFVVVL